MIMKDSRVTCPLPSNNASSTAAANVRREMRLSEPHRKDRGKPVEPELNHRQPMRPARKMFHNPQKEGVTRGPGRREI